MRPENHCSDNGQRLYLSAPLHLHHLIQTGSCQYSSASCVGSSMRKCGSKRVPKTAIAAQLPAERPPAAKQASPPHIPHPAMIGRKEQKPRLPQSKAGETMALSIVGFFPFLRSTCLKPPVLVSNTRLTIQTETPSSPPKEKRPEPFGSGRTVLSVVPPGFGKIPALLGAKRPSPVTEGSPPRLTSLSSAMLRDDFSGRFTGASTNRALSWLSLTGYCSPSSQYYIYTHVSIIYPVLIVKIMINAKSPFSAGK